MVEKAAPSRTVRLSRARTPPMVSAIEATAAIVAPEATSQKWTSAPTRASRPPT